MSIELPPGFQVVQRVFLVDPNGVEMLLRTDMRIGTGISLSSGFCPPASGGGGDIEVWTGGTRPDDLVLNGAPTGFDENAFVGFSVDFSPGVPQSLNLNFAINTASEDNTLEGYVSWSDTNWLIGMTYNGVDSIVDVDTGILNSDKICFGVLRCSDGYRMYVANNDTLFSAILECTPTPEAGSTLSVTSGNDGVVLANQEWFTGTPTADAYPTANLVSEWVADNSGA